MRTNRPYVQIDPDVLERVRQIDLLSYLREFEPSNLVTATLKELLQKDYKIVDDPPPVGKDFNDFLLSYLKIARPMPKRERSDAR